MSSPESSRESLAGIPVLALALGLVALAVTPAFYHDLWNPDEPRVAELARGIATGGDWIIPRVNGRKFIEQPPLHAWIVSLPTRLRGSGLDHAWVPRLPSMVLGLALLVLVYSIGRRIWNARVGVLAAVCLAITVEHFLAYHRVIVDTTLALCVALAMAPLVPLFDRTREEISWRSAVLLGISLGLSFLAKNLVGVTFVGLVGVALLVRNRKVFLGGRNLARWGLALVLTVVLPLPWLIAVGQQDPDALRELLHDNTVGRFFSTGKHNPPWYEFLHRGAAVLLPTLPLTLLAMWRWPWWRDRGEGERVRSSREGLFWWFVLPCALVLVSGSKREIYLLPAIPPVALLGASWLSHHWERPVVARIAKILIGILTLTITVAGLVGGVITSPLPGPFWVYLLVHLVILSRWFRKRGHPDVPEVRWVAVLLLLTTLGALSLIGFQARNEKESYEPLMEHLLEREREGFEIIGVELPLREVSALPHYLEHDIPEVERENLKDHLEERRRPAIYVSRDPFPEPLMGLPAREFRVRRIIHVVEFAGRGEDG